VALRKPARKTVVARDVILIMVTFQEIQPHLTLQQATSEDHPNLAAFTLVGNALVFDAALLAAELPGLPKEVRHEIQQHFQELSGWIRRTLEAGVRQRTVKLQGTAEDEAQTFMAVVHGAMLSARALGTSEVFQAVTSNALARIAMRKS
jgi:hypothetical protein